jgi:hypothetical protein
MMFGRPWAGAGAAVIKISYGTAGWIAVLDAAGIRVQPLRTQKAGQPETGSLATAGSNAGPRGISSTTLAGTSVCCLARL